MRKIVKKAVSVLLPATFLISMAGCGQKEETTQKSDVTSEKVDTVKIMSAVTGGKDEQEMKKFEEELSKATGLNIQIEKPASDYDQVLMQKLSGGEKYDLVYVGASQYKNLVEQDALLDITDRVKESKILSQNIDEQEWKDIAIDGKIYAGFNKKEVHRVVGLNNTMLKAAGIDYKSIEPTLEGYYEVFKALKENSTDPDFYPFDVVLSEAWDLQPWFAAEGLKEGIVTDENGKRSAPYATPEAAPVWEWLKKLYDEKLMDPGAFVDKTKDMRDKMSAASQKVAVTTDWAAWIGMHNTNAEAAGVSEGDYEIVSLPGVKTPDGDYMLAKGSASLFAVPANSENPDGAIKVLEYFATQEGGDLLSAGIEGSDYTKEGNEVTLTELGKQHAQDHGAPFPIYKDYKPLFPYARGVEEAMSYSSYATIDEIIPNENDYKEIVGKWGIQMVKGEISIEDGLKGMRNELVERNVTDQL